MWDEDGKLNFLNSTFCNEFKRFSQAAQESKKSNEFKRFFQAAQKKKKSNEFTRFSH